MDVAAAAASLIEGVIAAIGVGLQHAGPSRQVTLRMLAPLIARVVEHSRRWRWSAERAVIAHIGPTPAGVGLTPGQHRHGGVIAMQPLGAQHMGFDPLEHRL